MTASLSPGALPHPLAYATWVAPTKTNPETPLHTHRIMSRSLRLGPLPDALWILSLGYSHCQPIASHNRARAFHKSLNFRTFTEPEHNDARTHALNRLRTVWGLRPSLRLVRADVCEEPDHNPTQ